MKIFRQAGTGPGHRLIFDEMEFDAIGLQALRDAKCLPAEPSPVRIDRFVEKHFGITLEYQDLGSAVLGATMFSKNGKVCGMAVSTSLASEDKQNLFRSTVAHEAGHGLLHSILFMEDGSQTQFQIENADQNRRRILCRNTDINPNQRRGYDGRWWEYQANRMIGSLLLPAPLVKEIAKPYLTYTSITKSPILAPESREKVEAATADTFHVSRMVASIRLNEIFARSSEQEEF